MSQDNVQARIESALQRAAAYELLANSFAYPDAERLEALRECAGAVMSMECPVPLLRIAALARYAQREGLETVHVALNTLSSSPDCPSYESAYFGSDPQQQTQRMADLAGFYRAFGVDATEGGFRPDDLSVELEFMGFLCRKEAYAEEHLGPPRVRQARKAERIFLAEHLGRWAPAFAERLAELAPAGHFYGAAAQTLGWWLEREADALGVSPEAVALPAPRPPEPASHGPEFAGDASFVPVEALAVR